jgi:small GTP-binding protein
MSEIARRSKVVFLGDAGVGKTSIMLRRTRGSFEYEVHPTIGQSRSVTRVDLGAEQVDLALCDTAGQERFRALAPNVLREADVAVIVGSLTDYASIEEMTKCWAGLVTSHCSETVPVIGVINKIDLAAAGQPGEIQRLTNELRTQNVFVDVFAVSACTGERIDDLFQTIAIQAKGTPLLPPEAGTPLRDEKSGGDGASECC